MSAHLLLNGARIALLRTRLIHGHSPPVKHGSIEGRDGRLRFGVATHLNEGKSPRKCGVPIFDDVYAQYLPKRFEESTQRLF